VADLIAAFAGTSVPWARTGDTTDRSEIPFHCSKTYRPEPDRHQSESAANLESLGGAPAWGYGRIVAGRRRGPTVAPDRVSRHHANRLISIRPSSRCRHQAQTPLAQRAFDEL